MQDEEDLDEKKPCIILRQPSLILQKSSLHEKTWENLQTNTIYKHLSHHYILNRSFVFIADFNFDGSAIKNKVSEFIIRFFDSLQPDDQFGFIGLGENVSNLEIKLEKKSYNPYVKKIILESLNDLETL